MEIFFPKTSSLSNTQIQQNCVSMQCKNVSLRERKRNSTTITHTHFFGGERYNLYKNNHVRMKSHNLEKINVIQNKVIILSEVAWICLEEEFAFLLLYLFNSETAKEWPSIQPSIFYSLLILTRVAGGLERLSQLSLEGQRGTP